MDARSMLKDNGAKASELVVAVGDALSGAAGAVAKAIEAAAGPIAEMIEEKTEALTRTVEERATPLAGALAERAGAVGTTVDALARTVEEKAVPLAGVVTKSAGAVAKSAGALSEDLEEKFEKAREDVTKSVKGFKFGTREGVILGMVLGIFAAVWFIRRMDRQAARERLRAASARMGERTQALGGRVGEATQGLTSRVGPAAQDLTSRVSEVTHTLTDKAGSLASQAGEKVGQVAQNVSSRAGEVLQQVRGQADQEVEDAKLRLSDPTSPVREVVISESPRREETGVAELREALADSDLDKETQAAISEAAKEVQRVQDEALEQARNLGLSNGMKVVAFDGTDIGRVQEVREDMFVLDRPRGADLLVPLTEVARIEGTVAYLRIEVGQVAKMGWEKADPS